MPETIDLVTHVSIYPARNPNRARFFNQMIERFVYDGQLYAPIFSEDNFKTAPGIAVG